MSEFGINVDPRNPAGRPNPLLLRTMGFRWVRLVSRWGVDSYAEACQKLGMRVLAVIAAESNGWIIGHADAYEIGNEPDIASPSSWTMTQADYGNFARQMAGQVRAKNPGALVLSAGLASGAPDWLLGCGALPFNALAVHPYGRRPGNWPDASWGFGDMSTLIDAYRGYNLPVWVTEVGLNSDEVGEAFQAEYLARCVRGFKGTEVPVFIIFCWSDGMA